MNENPLISAIVVNWNGAEDLRQELPSLTKQTYSPLEIIVVDNGSTDDSREVVERFAGVHWLPLGQNRGLAGALNEGVRNARGELVLLLNNDMRFAEDFVAALALPLLEDEQVFASDGLQYDWKATRIVHAATFIGRRAGRATVAIDRLMPGLYIRQEVPESPVPVVMASGANLMARKKIFLELGGLDSLYAIGYEDTDICWRARLKGWKTVFVPGAVCWHNVGRSAKISEASARYRFRGNIAGGLRFSAKLLPIRFTLLMVAQVLAGGMADVLFLRWKRLKDRAGTLWGHFRHFPTVWSERRQLFRNSPSTPLAVLRDLATLEG